MAPANRPRLAPIEGRVLVATPLIEEPIFFRAVILLHEHDDDAGTLGVVLNRPTDYLVGDVLPGWQDRTSAPAVVFSGGPVADSAALALGLTASPPEMGADAPPGLTFLFDRLAVVDLEGDAALAEPDLHQLRIYRGYAGWGAHQLRNEVRSGAWWVFNSGAEDWFSSDPSQLWSSILRRQGAGWKMWATAPIDPEVN